MGNLVKFGKMIEQMSKELKQTVRPVIQISQNFTSLINSLKKINFGIDLTALKENIKTGRDTILSASI